MRAGLLFGVVILGWVTFAAGQAEAETRMFVVDGVSYPIEILPENVGGYDRDDWPHWNGRLGGHCFNVRDKVLAEESLVVVVTVPGSGGRCRVVSGHWHGPYTGEIFSQASDVDIGHLVPLHEAHKSGGHAWDRDRRQAYANDLGFKDHLIAVDDHENGTVKSDRDPKDYLPREEFRCNYLFAWVKVKQRWGLSMDAGESDAVSAVLASC